MLRFYRTRECPRCSRIEDALQDLAIAHEVVVTEEASGSPPDGVSPPALIDEGTVYQGADAILAHLEELGEFKELWYKFQSDACYCGEDGDVE